MVIREVRVKSVLSASGIHDYSLNPYTGCAHACTYCYARFMKRFTGHQEGWGEFVDVKVNAPERLLAEIKRKKPGTVWVSGVCDPYQPLERRYELTRRCLQVLALARFPVTVQTRSPLVLRDLDLFLKMERLEVGLTITTADDAIREIFEPQAPGIGERLAALEQLRQAGIMTFAMIAPLLPGAEGLVQLLAGKADRILVDRMNHGYGRWVYSKHGLEEMLSDRYFDGAARQIAASCQEIGMPCRVLF